MKLSAALLVLVLAGPFIGVSQDTGIDPWRRIDRKDVVYNRSKGASAISHWRLDLSSLQQEIAHRSHFSVAMPVADSLTYFNVSKSGLLSPGLASKFPSIKTYTGVNPEDPSMTLRFDITPRGFHGMILATGGIIYIDPQDPTDVYKSYPKKDSRRDGQHHTCLLHAAPKKKDQLPRDRSPVNTRVTASGSQLRKYRLAVTATGEYTAYHKGTVADALSAIVVTMNRVVGIYERELAITMELVDDTDQLIYTNAFTDPYTSSNLPLFISEVQENIDAVIGDANYDIGHGFSTGNGGLAEIRGVCRSGIKAQGVTGLNSPMGDPFDVDYVAHEIGHQFGATHTFNGNAGFCSFSSRWAGTAFEPGSGTTIMGYAGICAAQNIQDNSNDYFHTASLEQIIAFSTVGLGNSCPTRSDTQNNPPQVDAGTGGFFIPIRTPFRLQGSATDPEGHELTYCWEQLDLGPIGNPNLPQGNAPLFRSFPPVTETYRVFPQINDILEGTQTLGEILPATTRELTFRLTVRDNRPGGGGIGYDTLRLHATNTAGPFVITSQSETGVETGENLLNITWEVANTNLAPVSCQAVNILLSEDGGLTFPHLLATATPNDGAEVVVLPNISTTQARIKVEAADNIFFDISPVDFSIAEATKPGFFLTTRTTNNTICTPGQVTYEVIVGSILGFNGPISLTIGMLPGGVEATFSDSTVIAGSSTELVISNTGSIDGTYPLVITGTSDTVEKELTIDLNIVDMPPEVTAPVTPAANAVNVALNPTFSWRSLEDDGVSYQVQLASDAGYTDIIASDSGLVNNSFDPGEFLEDNRQYFWRVRANTFCNASEYMEATFKTIPLFPVQSTSNDVPKNISSGMPAIYTSVIEIPDLGTVYDVNVSSLIGEHTWLADLRMTLRSPAGTEVVLLSQVCSNSNDFDLKFDDHSPFAYYSISCPPTSGIAYQPLEPLVAFHGEEAKGIWTLIIEDLVEEDGGRLLSWGLEVSVEEDISAPFAPSDLSATAVSVEQVDLQWKDNSTDETAFVIERSENNNVLYVVIAEVEGNTEAFQDDSLPGQGIYYYRVKAVNEGGPSLYSKEVELPVIVGLEQDQKKLSFYPNPTDRWLNVTGTHSGRDFQVIITDTSGRRLAYFHSRNLNIPKTIDLAGLPPGLYLISIFNDEHAVKRKFIKR